MKNNKILSIFLSIAVISCLIFIIFTFIQNIKINYLIKQNKPFVVGDNSPHFNSKDINGNELSINGKNTLIFFFTTSCESCVKNFEELQTFYTNFKKRNFQFIGITSDDITNIKKATKKYKLTFPIVLDQKQKLFSDFRIQFIPTLIMIDSKGKIAYIRHYGQPVRDVLNEIKRTNL